MERQDLHSLFWRTEGIVVVLSSSSKDVIFLQYDKYLNINHPEIGCVGSVW